MTEHNFEKAALHNVVELHEWIADVFTGTASAQASLARLLQSFHPDFRMVTVDGKTLGRTEVHALFERNVGTRAGLEIGIDACEILLSSGHQAVCRYRETHTVAGNSRSRSRWSVAQIERSGSVLLWRYLQETIIADNPPI